GYETVIGERGITLSGGQRQRIAIARALVIDPRVLILDDATASVDATTEARIRLGLREAMKGRTTLIIAHRLSTIALADELVVLGEGRVVARGTHDELLGTSAVYREIYEHGLLERQFMDAVEARALEHGSADWIWCRDVLVHADVRSGLAECARVLRVGGCIVAYVTLATELLEPRETSALAASMALRPESLDPGELERAA